MSKPRKIRKPALIIPHIGYADVACVVLSCDSRFALIDQDDSHLAAPYCWRAMKYASGPYVVASSQKKTILLHRLVMASDRLTKKLDIDHRNSNPLDNRKRNLRVATRQQNLWHTKPSGRHGFKGISQHRNGRWHAEIGYNNGRIYLGYHATPEEAARAYDAKAAELYGEFAWLNFPQKAANG